jgi:hypothetical protein
MYRSPIDILVSDIQHQIAEKQDEQIYKAVVSVGINVDKDELIRALAYDRHQYMKGYADGEADATPKWISVKDERKPKNGEDTLVVVFNGYETYIDTDFFVCDREWYLESENRKVTHWMPLPEPPKEGI